MKTKKKTYLIKITQTEAYSTVVDVEADSREAAIIMMQEKYTLESLADEKNTYEGCDTRVETYMEPPAVHTIEELFNIDEEESDIRVIKVDDLSDTQKEFLGLPVILNEKPADPEPATFQVGSSGGALDVDSLTGKVLHCTTYDDEYNELKKIVFFDVEEYRRFHGIDVITGHVDILDIGYTTSDNQYEPPVADWRNEMRKQRDETDDESSKENNEEGE
jgi:hypothetical protein